MTSITLRPAHQVVIEQIETHCRNLAGVSKTLAGKTTPRPGTPISSNSLEMGKLQEIGGLCSQLRTIQSIIIPQENLDDAIRGLLAAMKIFPHGGFMLAIENLQRRKNGTPTEA